MDCPCCERDLTRMVKKNWSGVGSERFELVCPTCGNKVIVSILLSFEGKPTQAEAENEIRVGLINMAW